MVMKKAKGELLDSVKELLYDDEYSDLTIASRFKSFHVHRAIVCPRSKYFASECRSPQVSQRGVLDLPEDDPEAVEMVIRFLYQLDYDASHEEEPQQEPTGGPQQELEPETELEQEPLHASSLPEQPELLPQGDIPPPQPVASPETAENGLGQAETNAQLELPADETVAEAGSVKTEDLGDFLPIAPARSKSKRRKQRKKAASTVNAAAAAAAIEPATPTVTDPPSAIPVRGPTPPLSEPPTEPPMPPEASRPWSPSSATGMAATESRSGASASGDMHHHPDDWPLASPPGAPRGRALYQGYPLPAPLAEETTQALSAELGLAPGSLTVHARVFGLAQKYGIASLRRLALQKFEAEAYEDWDSDSFLHAAREVYSMPPAALEAEDADAGHGGLRDVVTSVVFTHPELLDQPRTQDAIRGLDLGYDLLMHVRRHGGFLRSQARRDRAGAFPGARAEDEDEDD